MGPAGARCFRYSFHPLTALSGCAHFNARCTPCLLLCVCPACILSWEHPQTPRPSCDPAPLPPRAAPDGPLGPASPPATACEGPDLGRESSGPGCWQGLVQLSPTPIHHTASPPSDSSRQAAAESRPPGVSSRRTLHVLYRALRVSSVLSELHREPVGQPLCGYPHFTVKETEAEAWSNPALGLAW